MNHGLPALVPQSPDYGAAGADRTDIRKERTKTEARESHESTRKPHQKKIIRVNSRDSRATFSSYSKAERVVLPATYRAC
jgi:beta-glucanase (GH16 family)